MSTGKQIDEARKVSESLLAQSIDIVTKLDPTKRYILYAEDEMFMRSFFSAYMSAHGVRNIILSENINQTISTLVTLNGKSKDLITCIVSDLDFGKTGGDVNDLIKIAVEKEIPIFVLSGMSDFSQYIDKELLPKILSFKKTDPKVLDKILDLIKGMNAKK